MRRALAVLAVLLVAGCAHGWMATSRGGPRTARLLGVPDPVPIHRSPVYEVGHCRAWIETLHGMEPHVEVKGNPSTLPPDQMRAFGVVLTYLAEQAKHG